MCQLKFILKKDTVIRSFLALSLWTVDLLLASALFLLSEQGHFSAAALKHTYSNRQWWTEAFVCRKGYKSQNTFPASYGVDQDAVYCVLGHNSDLWVISSLPLTYHPLVAESTLFLLTFRKCFLHKHGSLLQHLPQDHLDTSHKVLVQCGSQTPLGGILFT
jgi:hypothetical protein